MRIEKVLFLILVVGGWRNCYGKPILLESESSDDSQALKSDEDNQVSTNTIEEKPQQEHKDGQPKYELENLQYDASGHHLIKRVKKGAGCQGDVEQQIQAIVRQLSEVQAKVKMELEAVTKYEQASLAAQKAFADKRSVLHELNTEENVAKEESAASVRRATEWQDALARQDSCLCQARAQLNEMKTAKIRLVNIINCRSKREISSKIKGKQKSVKKRSPYTAGNGQHVMGGAEANYLSGLQNMLSQNLNQRAQAQPVELQSPELQRFDLQRSDTQRAELLSPELQRSNLQRSDFQRADLQLSDLQRSDLQHSDMQRGDLQRSDLLSPELQSSDFQRSDLQRSDLQRSNLQRSDLQRSDLQRSNLQRSDLQRSDLQRPDLQRPDLQLSPDQVFQRSAERLAQRLGQNNVRPNVNAMEQKQPVARQGCKTCEPSCDNGHPCKTAEQLANEERDKCEYNKLTEQIFLEEAKIQELSAGQAKTSLSANGENKRLELITRKLDQIKVNIKHTQQDALAAWLRVKISQEQLACHDEKLYQGRLQMDNLNAELTALRAGAICTRSKRDKSITKRHIQTSTNIKHKVKNNVT